MEIEGVIVGESEAPRAGNPFYGTTMADRWWVIRRAPRGRIAHLLDPISLLSTCGLVNPGWEYVEEDKPLPVCKRCRTVTGYLH